MLNAERLEITLLEGTKAYKAFLNNGAEVGIELAL